MMNLKVCDIRSNECMFRLIVDGRERFLIEHLERQVTDTFTFERKQLDLGDAVIVDENDSIALVIERKTVSDLECSIKDGRYQDQKNRMMANLNSKQILFVLEKNEAFGNLENMIKSAIIHTVLRDKMSMFFTTDVRETASLLISIFERFKKNPSYFNCDILHCKVDCTNIKKSKTEEDVQMQLFCQIPGVSLKTAKCLIERYKSMPRFLKHFDSNSIEELRDLKINNRRLSQSAIESIKKHLHLW